MGRIKNICLLTNMPGETCGKQVCEGVFSQCQKYGYNVAVFATLNEFDLFVKEIPEGEKAVYKIPDFSRFDGIVIDSVSFLTDHSGRIAEDLYRSVRVSGVPAVCISTPVDGIHLIENSNDEALRRICRHVTEVHQCKKVCILTGPQGNPEAESRLQVLTEELQRQGIDTPKEYRVYGDFWYTSGEQLAKKIASGEITRPEAVIAASDHMALGVIQALMDAGIRVPEDIIVAGFDLTDQGMLDEIPLTSITSNFAECAAKAVDHLVGILEPEREIMPFVPDYKRMLHIGKSCGCSYAADDVMKKFNTLIYRTHRNFNRKDAENYIDIGLLMENYIFERMIASETPDQCIENVYKSGYVLAPYEDFYLCLREDWLGEEMDLYQKMPEKMEIVLHRSAEEDEGFFEKEERSTFDSSLMLPQMFAEDAKPCAYYFSPVHFGRNGIGYAVLCRRFRDYEKFDLVYRNWLRFVSSALEMSRARNALAELSVRDKMTGLYNRRGMMACVEKMQSRADENKRMLVGVIDMDGLKYINDHYGHSEGDQGILRLGEAVKAFAKNDEISVRAGGDEFFVIGLNDYDDFDAERAIREFDTILETITARDHKEYKMTASLGFALGEKGGNEDFEVILGRADAEMYRNKQMRKNSRDRLQ